MGKSCPKSHLRVLGLRVGTKGALEMMSRRLNVVLKMKVVLATLKVEWRSSGSRSRDPLLTGRSQARLELLRMGCFEEPMRSVSLLLGHRLQHKSGHNGPRLQWGLRSREGMLRCSSAKYLQWAETIRWVFIPQDL